MEHVNTWNLLGVAVAMAISATITTLFPRLPVPGSVLEIVLGVLFGQQVLHILAPGPASSLFSLLGLAMLFLMAGFEMNPAILRGRPIRNALAGWGLSAVIALGAACLLVAAGLAGAPLMTALALTTTAIGALLPALRDADLLAPPYGPMVLAAGAVGEAGPVIILSLVLAEEGRTPLEVVLMIGFAAAAVGAVVLAARSQNAAFAAMVERSIGTSGQFPVRLAVCILIILMVISIQLSIDVVLAAFVAGALVRALVPPQQHEALSTRFDAVGYGFLVPIFFIISGVNLDVATLFSNPLALAMVPLYAVLMLVVRGLPALLIYRADLPFRDCVSLALHSGTQLPLVVAITAIAVDRGVMPGGQAAALVGAGIVTMLLFPALARLSFVGQTNLSDAHP
jgi:Kef-type K+ transport system membrane component KefB